MSGPELTEALRDALFALPTLFPPTRIDQLWLFSPRPLGERESGLLVLSLLPGPDEPADQRLVVTFHYEAERVRGRLRRTDSVVEQGRAPAERVPRVISGVLARLDRRGHPGEEPRGERIEGSPERWSALLRSLGLSPLDPANGE